jgi:hypothetical protein
MLSVPNYRMDPVAPTKFLDFVVETATKTANEKYADSGDFARYLFSSRQLPADSGFAAHVTEGARQFLFGDPLSLHHEMTGPTGGLGHALDRTFVPRAPDGRVSRVGVALNYGLPAAMTAMQYASMPAEQRQYHRGSLVGGALGGTLGSVLGSRFGTAGQFLLAPALQHAGTWLGSHFDKKQPEPAHYQVNPTPGTSPNVGAMHPQPQHPIT